MDAVLGIKDGRDVSTVMEDFDDVITFEHSFELPLFPNFGVSGDVKDVGLARHDGQLDQTDLTFGRRAQINALAVDGNGLAAADDFLQHL